MSMNRRRFFTRSGLVAATSLTTPHIFRAAEPGDARPGQLPTKIIHLVADGMSMGMLTMADHLSQLTRQKGLTWLKLYNHTGTVPAMMNVRSLNSLVTDSSASSCAWSTGSRIVNGTVNILPDGRVLKTLYELFGQAGWKRALVTTTEITHATPAGFAASGLRREAAETIAVQYLERKVDILLGGGNKFLDPARRADKRDLLNEYQTAGYTVMRKASDLAAAPKDKPWLGVFSDSHIPYWVDQIHDEATRASVPTLAAMTRRALEKLGRESRFILQVEGGRVDHAAHICDAAAALHEQIGFDEAIDVCLEFQAKHPDTLLVITTDHGTGNPGLNGTGKDYSASGPLFKNVLQVKASFGAIVKRLGGVDYPLALKTPPAPEQFAEVLKELTGYEAGKDKMKQFYPFIEGKGQSVYGTMNTFGIQFGQLMANHLGIGWTGSSHTADYVPLLALGPGADRFRGFIQNTDVFRHYMAFGKIDFRNPEVPLIASASPQAESLEDPHWEHDAIV
jgi:alkaline phosphatase